MLLRKSRRRWTLDTFEEARTRFKKDVQNQEGVRSKKCGKSEVSLYKIILVAN